MGIHSKVWGQYLWRLLHCLTYSYHPKLSSEIKAKYIRLFHVLKDFIPCPVCRSHYTNRCDRNPPERNMSSTDQFVIWLSNIHNEVNAGLGKPLIGKRQSDNMYVKNGKVNFDIRDFIVLFRIMTMINYVNFPAVQKFLQLFFEIYPNKTLTKYTPNSQKNIKTIFNNESLNTWIHQFDAEFAKNKKSKPYLSSYSPPIISTPKPKPLIPKNYSKNNSKIVKNDVNSFLQKYKII